jgi:hypothetical protein
MQIYRHGDILVTPVETLPRKSGEIIRIVSLKEKYGKFRLSTGDTQIDKIDE